MIKKVLHILILCWLSSSPLHAQIANDTHWDTSTNVVEIGDTLFNEVESEEEYEDGDYDTEDSVKSSLFEHRKITTSDWEKIKKDSAFIYKKNKVDIKDIEKVKPIFVGFAKFLSSGIFRFLMFAFVGLVIFSILYILVKHGNFSMKTFRRKNREVTENEPLEHIKEFTAWDRELQQALALPDYRKAIRIHYLRVLNLLDEKQLIRYQEDKTNWEYVHELTSFSEVKDFIQLTKYFDYIWYGEFPLDADAYQLLSAQFENFKQKIV